MPFLLTLCLVPALFTTPMSAEQFQLSDGRTLNGEILYQNEELILLNVRARGKTTPVTINRSNIVSTGDDEVTPNHIAPTPATETPTGNDDKPTYIHIPLRGEVGYSINNELLERALELARKQAPEVLILEIDSNGGSVESAIEMIGTLSMWRHETGIPLVALVRSRALSAASWIAAACDRVYVSPAATIGGALIFNSEGVVNDTPVGRKMESIFLSGIRGAVEDAGKNTLLVKAMIDPALVVSHAVAEDGEPLLWEGLPAEAPATETAYRLKPQLLVGPERVLTLTAREALATGLADKLIPTLSGVLADLKIPADQQASLAPAHVFESHYHKIKTVTDRYERLTNSLDGSLVNADTGAGVTAVSREDYTQLINRLQQVRQTVQKMRTMSKKHQWIAARLTQDLNQNPDTMLTAIDTHIATLKKSMPKPVRKRRNTIRSIVKRD